ncbi:universal stress protein [Caldimonas sp. KR1-144]|uniref:universal stress protein n=1 Tax=Caldimonas sp. KR1-144 TaxID=3400911 RepID=UPI003C0AC9F7
MYQRILVPVDGSPTSNAGLAEAIKLAKLTGAQLRLLHVVDELPFALGAEGGNAVAAEVLALGRKAGERILQDARTQVRDAGVAVDTVLSDAIGGRVSEFVAEQARLWDADLIVVGTHGRRGVGRWVLGSDAELILRMAPVAVLMVRAGGAT